MDTATSRNNCSSDTTLTQKPETLKKLKFAQADLGRGYAAQKKIIREALHKELNLLMIQEPYVGALAHVNIKYRVIQKLTHDVQKPDSRGAKVVEMIASTGLEVLNEGKTPTFYAIRRR